MRIAVFGGTGKVGGEVACRALERGHEVVVLARNPSAVTPADNLVIIEGSATDPDAVARALDGVDAVVSAMGARTLDATTDLSDATAGVIAGMQAHGPKRLVLLSHVGVLLKRVDPTYEHVVAEHRRNLEAVRESGLDWVAVCPPGINGASATGEVVAVEGSRGPAWFIPRGDLADFLLDQIVSDVFLRMTVGVSGPSE